MKNMKILTTSKVVRVEKNQSFYIIIIIIIVH